MIASRSFWPAAGLGLGLLAVMAAGCATVPEGGYGYGSSNGYGGDLGIWPGYYEPAGGFVGDWEPGYRIGPAKEPLGPPAGSMEWQATGAKGAPQ